MFKRTGGDGKDDNVIKMRPSFRRSGVKDSNLPMIPAPKESVDQFTRNSNSPFTILPSLVTPST